MNFPEFKTNQGLTKKQRSYIDSGRVEPVVKAVKLSQTQIKLLEAMAVEGAVVISDLQAMTHTLLPDGKSVKKNTLDVLEKHRLVKLARGDKAWVKEFYISDLGKKTLENKQ